MYLNEILFISIIFYFLFILFVFLNFKCFEKYVEFLRVFYKNSLGKILWGK